MFIEIKDLSFRYPQAIQDTLQNITFSIERGRQVCVLGKSGSGKSTLLRLLAGLEIPKSGSITIQHIVLANDQQFIQPERRAIGMVFQDYALFPHLTVADNISFGLRNMKRTEKQQRLGEMLEMMELSEYRDRYPYECSGGQQQRVALARALIVKPDVLLLDEPMSNLDVSLKIKIREDLSRILKSTQTTTIMVTHDHLDCAYFADDVLILQEGKLVQAASLREAMESPFNDYVSQLMKSG